MSRCVSGKRIVPPIALFIIFVLLIALVLFAVWRYWSNLARVSPEEEAYDEQVAALNEYQANRISDKFLTRSMSEDDAWQIMVRQGRRVNIRRRRQLRATQPRATQPRAILPPREQPPRRERYGGELSRRIDERRDRQGNTPTPPGRPLRRDPADREE